MSLGPRYCKYGDRDAQFLVFPNGSINMWTSYGGRYLALDPEGYRKVISTIGDLKTDPGQIKFDRAQAGLGPMLTTRFNVADKDCVGFRAAIGAGSGSMIGSGPHLGYVQYAEGRYCQDATNASSDFPAEAITRIKGLRLREK